MKTLVEQYAEAVKVAKELGWSVSDEKEWFKAGPTFEIDHGHYITRVWRTYYGWQVADLIAGYYTNHRPSASVIGALKTGCLAQTTPGSEFWLGQRVTFKPYELELPATVVGISKEGDEIIYKLRNVPKTRFERPVVSDTSGRCIMESVLFEENTD